MAGGYAHDPKGIDAITRMVRDLQRQIDAIRGSAGIKSAILRGNSIEFQDVNGNLLARVGVGPGFGPGAEFDGSAGLLTFDPATGIPLLLAGFNDQWNASGVYVYDASGDAMMIVQDVPGDSRYAAFGQGGTLESFSVSAREVIYLLSDGPTGQVILRGTQGVYIDSIATTTNPASLNIDAASGLLRRVTSGRKYKADIRPADIDLDDARAFLALGRTWVDKAALESDPNFAIRTAGSIAEELDSLPSMRQFVQYDESGEPDGIYYERLYVALLPLLKHLDDTASQQAAEIDTLKSTVSALEARLDALEGRT